MNEQEKWNLLASIASGNINEKDRQDIERLILEDSAFRAEVEDANKLYHDSHESMLVSFDFVKAQQKVVAHIDRQKHEALQDRARLTSRRVMRWLAAACILSGISVWWFAKQTSSEVRAPIFLEVTAGKGIDLQKVTLADGTTVYLNGKTRLRYPSSFEANERKVILDGDAFFEVSKDSKRPFIVQSGPINIVVLGTSFRIRGDQSNKKNIEIMVATGKVAVKKDTATLSLLTPGEGLEYNATVNSIIKRTYDEVEIMSINHETLLFDNTQLTDVALELEKWFGYKVMLHGEKINTYRFSGEFHKPILKDILQSLAISSSLRYEIQSDTIHLRNNQQ